MNIVLLPVAISDIKIIFPKFSLKLDSILKDATTIYLVGIKSKDITDRNLFLNLQAADTLQWVLQGMVIKV